MALESKTAYLLLGSNLGDRQTVLEQAIALLALRAGMVVARSSFYETAAWGKTDQPAFLNLALQIETTLTPLALLDQALGIEAELGRVRIEKWGERIIDIDLILFGAEVIDIPGRLQVPHPHMQERKFVMVPLAEIAPLVVHPVLHATISLIAQNLTDNLSVKKI